VREFTSGVAGEGIRGSELEMQLKMSNRIEAVRKGGGLKVGEGVILVEDEFILGVEKGYYFVVTRVLSAQIPRKHME